MYWKGSGDPFLPEWLDFNGFPDWMVEIAAEQYVRTDGAVLLLPDEIQRRPVGWEEAVKRYVNLINVAKPKEKPEQKTDASA